MKQKHHSLHGELHAVAEGWVVTEDRIAWSTAFSAGSDIQLAGPPHADNAVVCIVIEQLTLRTTET